MVDAWCFVLGGGERTHLLTNLTPDAIRHPVTVLPENSEGGKGQLKQQIPFIRKPNLHSYSFFRL